MTQAASLSILLCSALGAGEEAPLFVWVDPRGAVQITDRLADVPEPWFALYQARLAEQQRRGSAPSPVAGPAPAPAAAAPAAPGPSVTESVRAQRQMWRNLVEQWRTELAAATRQLQEAEQQLELAGANPVLREIAPQRARWQAAEQTRDRARARVEAARRMLLEGLPKRAHDEHVPPLWVQ